LTVFPAALTVNVVMVGGVRSLILSILAEPALLKLVIVPELVRLTIPLALLVMLVMAPAPPRFKLSVLISEFIEQEPPMFNVPAFVSFPVPANAVPTLSVPLLVTVTEAVRFSMDNVPVKDWLLVLNV